MVHIIQVVLVQATPKHGQDVPDLAGGHRPGKERLEGGIGADGDGANSGREDEYRERGIVRGVCALRDAAEPGVPRDRLVTAVGEEDARGGNELHERISLNNGILLCAIGDDSQTQPRTPSGKRR